MSKSTKVLMIAAIALLFAGVVLAVVGFALYGWPERIRSADLEPVVYTYNADEVSSLYLEDYNAAVHIRASEDGLFRAELLEDPNRPYKVNLSQGKLTIQRKSPRFTFSFFFWESSVWESPPELFIYLPESVNQASVEVVNGPVTAENLTLANFTAESVNGALTLTNITATSAVSAESVNGPIDIHNAAAARILLSATNGNIEMQSVSALTSLSAETVNGKIRATASGAPEGKVQFSTVNGDILLEKLTGADIALSTVSGDIEGSITGDPAAFAIQAETVNGDKNLPRSGDGPNRLELSTVTGDMDIFIGE